MSSTSSQQTDHHCKIAKYITDKGVNRFKEKDSSCPTLQILVCGSEKVGKSKIINRILYNKFSSTSELLVSKCILKRKFVYNKKSFIFNFKIVTGTKEKRLDYKEEYLEADCVLLVFDLTNSSSFQDLHKYMQEIYCYVRKETLIILIGNKSDDMNRRVTSSEIISFCANYKNLEYIEVSAKLNNTIKEIPMKVCELFQKCTTN